MNLDPFSQHSDGELWSVLEMSYLKSFVTKTADGLDYKISESGENLRYLIIQFLFDDIFISSRKVLVKDNWCV